MTRLNRRPEEHALCCQFSFVQGVAMDTLCPRNDYAILADKLLSSLQFDASMCMIKRSGLDDLSLSLGAEFAANTCS